MFLTGGKLELSKCFWIPIIWGWKKGELILVTKKRSEVQLKLTESETGNLVQIPRVKPTDAEKRLGIRYSLDGKWTAEYKFWHQHTKSFAQSMKSAHLDRLGGYHAYKTIWSSKFRYSSPILGFSSRQLLCIQKLLIGACLSAAGYNSKMPRAVVFGTSRYGGMNWESPQSILIFEQIKLFIGSMRLNDTVGELLKIQLTWIQIIAGVEIPVFESTKLIPYLPQGWLQSLHCHLVETGITIQIHDIWKPTAQREGDKVIMTFVVHNLPEWMWRAINFCRLYLQAVTFSDITTFDGRVIPKEVYNVEKPYRQSRLLFPRPYRPSKADRAHWKHFIRYITSDTRTLLTPLWKWNQNPMQIFPYVWEPTSDLIYKWTTENNWEIYYLKEHTRNTYVKGEVVRTKLPNRWLPINVIKHSKDELARIIPEESIVTPPIRSPVFGLFEQPEIKQVVGQFEINLSVMEQLKRKWHNAPIKLVCGADGGLKDCIGTNGYVVYTHPEELELLRGYSAEIQLHENASVTRQELLGQLAIDFWLQHMVVTFGEPTAAVEVHIVTDSQASIDIVNNVRNKIGIKDVLKPDTDVALAILYQRAKLPWMKYHVIKVRSHIAVEESPNEFFWMVNDTSDQLAMEARDKVITNEIVAKRPILLPGMVIGCKIGPELIYQDLKVRLHKQLHEDTIHQYLCSKYGWTESVAQTIDWVAHEQALNSFTLIRE